MILSHRRLLMLRRSGSHGAGTWCPPGGHLEWQETPEQAVVRETLEETGVTVGAVRRLGFTNDIHATEDKHYITVFVLCRHISGEPRITEPEKCQQVEWVLIDGVHCRELFLPIKTFLEENSGILEQLTLEVY